MPTSQRANQLTSKLIFIVGPTASGKSDLAFQIAQKIPCNILVADSRQVYKDIPITSGADIPADFNQQHSQQLTYPFFSNGYSELHGVCFLGAEAEWSLGLFYKLAKEVIQRSLSQSKVLLIVGGTGLYTHSLLLSDDQILPPPSNDLRTELQTLSLTELQQKIISIQPESRNMFNNSDWHNPRRLIRAIEILSTSEKQKTDINQVQNMVTVKDDQENMRQIIPKWFGIDIDKEEMESKITSRVESRILAGAIEEVERLTSWVEDKKLNIFTATGVKEILGFLQEQYDQQTLIQLWTKREFQYAKRQITWFKKRPYIQWYEKKQLQTLLLDT